MPLTKIQYGAKRTRPRFNRETRKVMLFIQAPLPRHHFFTEDILDDMIPETLLLAGVSLAATYVAAGGQTDLICIPGAMLGAVVALLKATQERRLWTDKAIIVIGSSVIGTTLPSGAAHLMWPQWIEKLTWHVYFLAGFLCSIIGWMLAWPIILALDARREKLANAAIKMAEMRYGISNFPNSDSSPGGKIVK